MNKQLGWLLLLAAGYALWKQRQTKKGVTTVGPENVASMPTGSAAVVLTQQIAVSPF